MPDPGAKQGPQGVQLTGYIQAQAQLDQQSQDQLAQGGAQLNQDLLLVRRGRIAITRAWDRAAVAFELDANTVRGATVGLRRAEASLFWPRATDDGALPTLALTVGLTDIPFGHELIESSRARLFDERTAASLAFFPGEPDIGARLWGGVRQFRYQLAVSAGEPVNERAGQNRPDPNAAKDVLGRVGVDTAPRDGITVAGGVSLLAGTGFHAGKSATKDGVEWRDTNQNGAIDTGELIAVPGTAATPSENFRRWALGADVEVGVRSRLGWTRVYGEVTIASNLDRGLYVADPITAGGDVRELGAYAAAIQDLGSRAFVGLRFDVYDPNLDAFDDRKGTLIPTDARLLTLSPLVGVRLPWHARVTVQYDHITDNLARDRRGVPTDLKNDRITARLQVEL
ncbi:MAG: OprO/OprP family phosphate-selective porin [Deltaproteobacteria bacterium]|nr:OprO/OprP family phosphate-selective porin [Deltaproteobacteria bacterium]